MLNTCRNIRILVFEASEYSEKANEIVAVVLASSQRFNVKFTIDYLTEAQTPVSNRVQC